MCSSSTDVRHRDAPRATRKDVGRRLRASREQQQLSQRELARRIGITQASLSNYENGKREMSLFVALEVSAALRVPLGVLVPVPGMTVAPTVDMPCACQDARAV